MLDEARIHNGTALTSGTALSEDAVFIAINCSLQEPSVEFHRSFFSELLIAASLIFSKAVNFKSDTSKSKFQLLGKTTKKYLYFSIFF